MTRLLKVIEMKTLIAKENLALEKPLKRSTSRTCSGPDMEASQKQWKLLLFKSTAGFNACHLRKFTSPFCLATTHMGWMLACNWFVQFLIAKLCHSKGRMPCIYIRPVVGWRLTDVITIYFASIKPSMTVLFKRTKPNILHLLASRCPGDPLRNQGTSIRHPWGPLGTHWIPLGAQGIL